MALTTERDPGADVVADRGPDVGSAAGFEAFARTAQQRLYRTAYLLCGDAEQARDLTRTTLAKLYQHCGRRGRPSIRTPTPRPC
ncbi:hypothetical protein GCM10010282_35690 [Streptomyces roseolus]|nr:hypothetical protein GCM10010282_35690 [Streptomyces roseolus]